ncbi:hypothetical protein [Aporhodopirellula aestuarii]|uniref:hypothetical protein n=1 Tax=Aporhodopirellula aestuarii TaxID=2950107 RepID=UPI0020349E4E|nr:hypothetical protein [Aporhodopirellula aestuarii]
MNEKNKNRRFAESFTGAILGVIIGEMARQMVQYDHVPLWRVLILITAALVGGFAIAFSLRSSKQDSSPAQNKSHNNESASESD